MTALTRRTASLVVTALLGMQLLAACTTNTPTTQPGDPRNLTVQSTDTECVASAADAPSGTLRFTVTNAGSKVTEFYLLAADGLRIVGEVENIGPGLSRDLLLTAAPGSYFTACKPGMIGDGIRTPFAVTDSGKNTSAAPGNDQALIDQASTSYASYVRNQTEQLVAKTTTFTAAYLAGEDQKARTLYPQARLHWERIEPVAESFGALDAQMDLREADLAKGQAWTGWHRIEKDLWPARANSYTPLTKTQRKQYAADLTDNIDRLNQRTRTLTVTPDQISNGSRNLLDEVATTKVTGEEEYWSRTDLWDIQGNVDGARVGFESLQPLLQTKDPALAAQLTDRFAALQALLDQHKTDDGFTLYNQLTQADVKTLSDTVNALSEPLSKLTAAVI